MSKNFSVPQAAERLGLSVSTVYHLISAKGIEYYKVGQRVLISESTIEAFLEAHRVPSIAATAVEGQK